MLGGKGAKKVNKYGGRVNSSGIVEEESSQHFLYPFGVVGIQRGASVRG